ncbi:Hypothetical_protein [Hexamita inflata]|uniref:Hypothetical_protein n=1 Tax=Hexamita inflata TaxID=28002 RepID=A0AA86P012_9EUKA|nr:Hypothetical protein HINF_LOCUS16671 [Hexamita inflata]CAI9957814.1 Hypothetical protein HINF_LOCUS45459 [Hexamita inflata]
MSKFLSGTGTKTFMSRDLIPGQSDSQTLVQSIGYLVKSQVMSVRTISNFRSFVSFLLANTESMKSENIQQMRQVCDEITQDSSQFFTYMMKLIGFIQQTPSLNSVQASAQNLRAEIDALIQDSDSRHYIFSPLLLEFATGRKSPPSDPVSVLSNVPTYQKISDQEVQLQAQAEEIASLQQHIQLLQEQATTMQQQLEQFKQNQTQSSTQIQLNQQNRTQNSEELVSKLEAENQLLRQNVQDLRKTLSSSQTAEKAAQNVLEVLKDSMRRDKELINELMGQKNSLQEKLTQFELRGVDQAHIEAIQLGLKQVLSVGNQAANFVDGTDSRSVQKNISQVTQVVFELQQQINKLLLEQNNLKDQINTQKSENEKANQQLLQIQGQNKQQLKEKDMQLQETIEKTRMEVLNQNKKVVQEQENKNAKLIEENKQLRDTAEILQLQLQTVNTQSNENQLKLQFKQAISQLKGDVKEIQDVLNINTQELDFVTIKRKIKELLDVQRENKQIVEVMSVLLDQQEQIERAVAGYVGRD